jgi:F-type H+-transporting ATPase subunit epsilon
MADIHSSTGTGKALKCVVVTPERAVLEQEADFVALPMFDGELGVLPGRSPLIGRLGIGELRVKHGHEVTHLFIDGGFAQVRGNVVTVLTPSAQTAAEIKPDTVREALRAAESTKATSPEQMEQRAKAQQRARVKLHLTGQKSTESHAASH